MKHKLIFVINIVFAVLLFSFFEARPQEEKTLKQHKNTIEPMPAPDAYEILKTLNSRGELIPPVVGKKKLKDLRPINCFGIKLPNGKRLMGESSGKSYGLDIDIPGGGYAVMIGALYIETTLFYKDQHIEKGPSVVFVGTDFLILLSSGSKFYKFPLTFQIDPILIEEKRTGPKFSLTYEDNAVVIAVEKNKILLFLEDKVSVEQQPEFKNKVFSPAIIEAFINHLNDKDATVRRKAAKQLGETNDSSAVEPLIAALNDRSFFVQSAAAEALGKTKDTRAVEPLIVALKNEVNKYVRRKAAIALGNIHDQRALEPLILSLLDEDKYVRTNSVEALKQITEENFGENFEEWEAWWKTKQTSQKK